MTVGKTKADHEDYEGFVGKFAPKRTTDDCMTPPAVYDAVRDRACAEYGIDPSKIVRPFWPGGDYERFEYPPGCVVLDNPPFSILTPIVRWYLERGIDFFLFAPMLTLLSGSSTCMRVDHIAVDGRITYANGATVRTGFLTSLGGDEVLRTAPDLARAIDAAMGRGQGPALPPYRYPPNVITAAQAARLSTYGVELSVRRGECARVSALDAQRPCGKGIFGGGLLLSGAKASEVEAALSEADEAQARAARARIEEQEARAVEWGLSERERQVVAGLG